jgi:acetyl/propionyl-CoA carboxylase alpha subunit
MRRALSEYAIEGVATNVPACNFVLSHPSFQSGIYDTGFFARWYTPEAQPTPDQGLTNAMALLGAWLQGTEASTARGTPPQQTGPANVTTGWRSGRMRAMRGGVE